MMYSMTGYGKEDFQFQNKKIFIEIKSLNSKQLDINTRLPGYYKGKEVEIRNFLSTHLIRGKIEFSLFVDSSETESVAKINEKAIINYYNQLKTISEKLEIEDESNWFSILTRLPDVLSSERTELNEAEWNSVFSNIEKAIEKLLAFREQEGMALEKDITKRIYTINNLIAELEVFEDSRIESIRNRLLSNLKEVGEDIKYDENRFEQEMIYYLEKLDINEEKVRLQNHCNYFLENIKSEEAIGKKLGFISQEIGREINTIGSKANNADVQRIVVQMKDELEKIKEQLMNVL